MINRLRPAARQLREFLDIKTRINDREGTVLIRELDKAFDQRLSDVLRSAADPGLKKLIEDGFVNLGPSGINTEYLANLCATRFSQLEKESVAPVLFATEPFLAYPELTTVLSSDTLKTVLEEYYGCDVVFDRAICFRIRASSARPDISGLWHHDRVGHRIKVFLLLHDVGPDQRPTKYAVGSHRQQYASYRYKDTRFTQEYVENNYEVESLIGKAGDMVAFDTNGLHRGTWEEASSHRDAISLEFSEPARGDFLGDRGFPIGIKKELFPPLNFPDEFMLASNRLKQKSKHNVYGEIEAYTTQPVISLVEPKESSNVA